MEGGVTLGIPKHPSSPYPGVADGGIGVSHPCTSLGGVCHPLQAKGRQKRVKAVADCKGDKARELTFSKGEVIVVTREEDEQSWVSVSVAWTSLGSQPWSLPPPPVLFWRRLGVHGGHGWVPNCPICAGRRAGEAPTDVPPWVCLSKSLWDIGPKASPLPEVGLSPILLTPPLCTPRSASSRAMAPAPVSSQPASSTYCKTDLGGGGPSCPCPLGWDPKQLPTSAAPVPGAWQSWATRDIRPGPWRGTIQPGWTLPSMGAWTPPPHWEDHPWRAAAGSPVGRAENRHARHSGGLRFLCWPLVSPGHAAPPSLPWALPIPRAFFSPVCKALGMGGLCLVPPTLLCQGTMGTPPSSPAWGEQGWGAAM